MVASNLKVRRCSAVAAYKYNTLMVGSDRVTMHPYDSPERQTKEQMEVKFHEVGGDSPKEDNTSEMWPFIWKISWMRMWNTDEVAQVGLLHDSWYFKRNWRQKKSASLTIITPFSRNIEFIHLNSFTWTCPQKGFLVKIDWEEPIKGEENIMSQGWKLHCKPSEQPLCTN